jgi:hypothetical protein
MEDVLWKKKLQNWWWIEDVSKKQQIVSCLRHKTQESCHICIQIRPLWLLNSMTQTTIMTSLLNKICDEWWLSFCTLFWCVHFLIFFMGGFYHSWRVKNNTLGMHIFLYCGIQQKNCVSLWDLKILMHFQEHFSSIIWGCVVFTYF